ncbi:MAG: hypothetical protein DI603_05100 [Roseateles depolymerans]|uniref:O-antigen polysaccharide polymerase Wzy n=1 Tax=Roseateles depolymerans TaxID=76731 RepID=A0A2W5FXJ2_9BURK|nr:MAG: hypothetical protein DI603_05100 [Roseateles depolymerans]
MTNRNALLLGVAVLVLAALVAQMVIGPSAENIGVACIVTASSLSILLYIYWTRALDTHPLSTYALFGFCFTTQMGALLFQSGGGEAITRYLRQPGTTFGWLAAYQWTAMAAHAAYRVFSERRAGANPRFAFSEGPLRRLLRVIGLYSAPSPGVLWAVSVFGLFGILFGGIPNTMGKVFHGMSFLAWAPFLIPIFIVEYGASYARPSRQLPFVAAYTVFIAVLAMAANARAMMLSGLMTVSLFLALTALRSQARFKPKFLVYGVVLAAGLAVLSYPVNDLVTAMRIARKDRGHIDIFRMVENTLYNFQRDDLLKAERSAGQFISLNSNYDELYFNSELEGRLVETKFHDNALYFGSRLSAADNERLLETTADFLWAILPQPVLDKLGVDLAKKSVFFSMGDYMSYLGATGKVGGFRTGSGVAHGLALFGEAFLPVMFLLFFVVFWSIDLLAYALPSGRVAVSALGLLGIWPLFQYGICTESITGLLSYIVRGLPQNVLIYTVAIACASLGLRMWSRMPARRLQPLVARGGV